MIRMDAVTADTAGLREVLGCFPSGVAAVCALVDGVPVGMAASSFTSVSMTPPLVSVCVQTTSTTWLKLRGRDRLGVSVLAEGHDAACRALSMKQGDRFADVDWEVGEDGGVFVLGSSAWLECSLHAELPAGDHSIALLRIHCARADPDQSPLVFHGSRFRRLAAL